jgi:hypothetical protein
MTFVISNRPKYISSNQSSIAIDKHTQPYKLNSTWSNKASIQQIASVDEIAKTQSLLDRAIAVACRTVESNHRPPALTPERWVWGLAGSYHLSHIAPQLIEEASQRFAVSGCQSLAQWLRQQAIEELGHDRLALLDIQSMGYRAEAVVQTLIPPATVALVNYLDRSVQGSYPVSCIGCKYAIERIATGIKEKHIQLIEDLLPPNVRATRCLHTHSSVGSDAGHVKEVVKMIAGLSPADRTHVVGACYETALLCFGFSEEDDIAEEDLQRLLQPLRL